MLLARAAAAGRVQRLADALVAAVDHVEHRVDRVDGVHVEVELLAFDHVVAEERVVAVRAADRAVRHLPAVVEVAEVERDQLRARDHHRHEVLVARVERRLVALRLLVELRIERVAAARERHERYERCGSELHRCSR